MFLGRHLLPPISIGFYPPCGSKHHCKFVLGTCPAVPPALPLTPHGSKCTLLTFFTWKKLVPISLLWRVLCHAVQGSGVPEPGVALPGARQPRWCAGVPHALPAQPGAGEGPCAPTALVWQGRRPRAESHVPAELAEIWYQTTAGWHEHVETRRVVNKATEWSWPTVSVFYCCACSVHLLIDFQERGWHQRVNKNKLEWQVLWEKLLETIFVGPRSLL